MQGRFFFKKINRGATLIPLYIILNVFQNIEALSILFGF